MLKLSGEDHQLCKLPPGKEQNQTYLQRHQLPGLTKSQPSYLSLRKAERGVLGSKTKFALVLHGFKGHIHLGEKEEIKATENTNWPLD